MSEEADDGWGLDRVAGVAKALGKTAALPVAQNVLRQQVVTVLTQHDPEVLEDYILVNYSLVDNQLPPEVENTLGNVGPQFEGPIKKFVRPESILSWMEDPEEWMDDEQYAEVGEDVETCAEIIRTTPGGVKWLEEECVRLWDVAGVL